MLNATLARPDAPTTPSVDQTTLTLVPDELFPARSRSGNPDVYLTAQQPRRGTTTAHRFAITLLGRYTGGTRDLYDRYLGRWFAWCATHKLDPFAADRPTLEAYVHELVDAGLTPSTVHTALSPVRTMYKLAHADGLIPRNPGLLMWLPKKTRDPHSFAWLDCYDLDRWIDVSRTISPRHWATGELLGTLALRASELASLNVEDTLHHEDGHRVVKFIGKGDKPATVPLPIPVQRAVDAVIAGRVSGPLIPTRTGEHLTRHGVTTLVETICRHAKVELMSPHGIRRSVITKALDKGMGVREAQKLARHENIETTMLYDRWGANLDSHPVYALSSSRGR